MRPRSGCSPSFRRVSLWLSSVNEFSRVSSRLWSFDQPWKHLIAKPVSIAKPCLFELASNVFKFGSHILHRISLSIQSSRGLIIGHAFTVLVASGRNLREKRWVQGALYLSEGIESLGPYGCDLWSSVNQIWEPLPERVSIFLISLRGPVFFSFRSLYYDNCYFLSWFLNLYLLVFLAKSNLPLTFYLSLVLILSSQNFTCHFMFRLITR